MTKISKKELKEFFDKIGNAPLRLSRPISNFTFCSVCGYAIGRDEKECPFSKNKLHEIEEVMLK